MTAQATWKVFMNVETKVSEIHGTGVFARNLIEEGDWQYVYGYEKKYVPGDISERYGFVCDDDDMIFIPYAPWCFCNHAVVANCLVTTEDGMTVITALRDIQPGEEIVIDYGFDPT